MKQISLIFISCIIITALLISCGGDSSPAPEEKTHYDVVMKVYGTTGEASISYNCFFDPPVAGDWAELPWEFEHSCEITKGEGMRIYAVPKTDPGTLSCEIYADGELVASDSLPEEGTQRVKCEFIPDIP